MKQAQFILDNAESNPGKVREALVELHQKGETVQDILDFARALELRKVNVPRFNFPVFDLCGTGGTGKERINLSTVLAVLLSQKFSIAKHGNKAASGRVGSFDLIEGAGFEIGDTPEKVTEQIKQKNLSFVYAPAFHPALKPLAPIRKSIDHSTIFNYLGPLLNPVELAGQMTGVSSIEVGDKLAEVALKMRRPTCFVHDTAFGLDDVSIGGATRFWMVGITSKTINSGAFFPEDYGCTTVKNFDEIKGGDLKTNQEIALNLLQGKGTQVQQDFLRINYLVAEEFFNNFVPK